MLFNIFLLAGLTSAAPALTSRQVTTEYAPWEITSITGTRPSGRPNSSPNSTLSINIKQPNTIKLQRVPNGYAVLPAFEASCTWTWPMAQALPDDAETTCNTVGDTTTYGSFTMTVSGTSLDDYSVAIKESRDVTVFQQQYIRVFEGEQTFKRGDGVWTIVCGASGFCQWQTVAGVLPLKVTQELTASVGSCEEATVGSC